MQRNEAVEVLKAVETFYAGKFKVDDPQRTLDAWFSILKDYEFNEIMHNLQDYVKKSRYAPTVADLVSIEPTKDRAIPTYDETLDIIYKPDTRSMEEILEGKPRRSDPIEKADEKVVSDQLQQMRKLLGIKRG